MKIRPETTAAGVRQAMENAARMRRMMGHEDPRMAKLHPLVRDLATTSAKTDNGAPLIAIYRLAGKRADEIRTLDLSSYPSGQKLPPDHVPDHWILEDDPELGLLFRKPPEIT